MNREEYITKLKFIYRDKLEPTLHEMEKLTDEYRTEKGTTMPEHRMYSSIIDVIRRRLALSGAFIWDRLSNKPESSRPDRYNEMQKTKRFLGYINTKK